MADKTDSSGSTPGNDARHSLSEIELLTEAKPALLKKLVKTCEWSEWQDGDVIIDKDDASTDVYFVVEGQVRITEYIEEDREVAIAEFDAGACFGELSAIDLKARSARVMATGPTLLASLSAKEFRRLLLDCPEISLVLLKRLASYVRKVTARMSAMSVQTPRQRVCVELLRMSEPDIGREGRWIIANFPGHGEIASWTGTDREIVAETIGQLARNGIVERRHRTLRINDHAKLQRLAEQH
ncbi:MAG: Crp/Fnr family transcriptional regulator [Rhodospirillales bacterium]